jgi:hypothetical protein
MTTGQDLQPLLDVQQNQLSFQLSVSDTTDTKALALLATDVAILLFVAQDNLHLHWWGWLLSIAPYLLSILLGAIAIWPRNYSGAGVTLDDHPEYLSLESGDLVLQLLADTQEAINTNKLLNAHKLRFFTASILAGVLATITLSFILLV